MTLWQSLFFGFLQGATELFPVSSLGHAVLLPQLLGLGYDQSDPAFLPFLVLLHLGTASALLLVFREDWVRLFRAFFRSVAARRIDGPDGRLAMLLLAGTIPAGLLGFVFEHPLERLFQAPRVAAAFLIVNAAIMFGGELLRRRDARKQEAAYAVESELSFPAALAVGSAQALALFPGISRSGATISGGLLAGLSHEAAARFSFLLATPIILAAGLLEVPSLRHAGSALPVYLAGALTAAVTAYLSTRFLLRYFRSGRLDPFAAYCLLLGALGLLLLR